MADSADRRRIFIEDHTGNKRREARIATRAAVRDLIPALITALGLPATDPSGRPVTYHLAFDDRQLQEEETLEDAGLVEGATVTIVPEMTAGQTPQTMLASLPDSQSMVVLGRVWRHPPQREVPAVQWPWYGTARLRYSITPEAQQAFNAHVQSRHEVEVGGAILGEVYQERTTFLVQMTQVLPARHTTSSPVCITFTGRTWLDISARRRDYPDTQLVGWYHSHPGLGVFLSRSDRFIHRRFFGDQPWYMALVVDPLSGEQGVFGWEQRDIVRLAGSPMPLQSSEKGCVL